jgi:hypothetical protein
MPWLQLQLPHQRQSWRFLKSSQAKMDAGIRTITKPFCSVLFGSMKEGTHKFHSACPEKCALPTHQICRACAFTNQLHVGPEKLEETMELEWFSSTDNAITKVCVGGKTQCHSGHEKWSDDVNDIAWL